MDTNQYQLDEPSRAKLDGVVMKMHQNKETDENIQAVVNDFKQKYGKVQADVPDEQPVENENGTVKKAGGLVKGLVQGLASVPLKLASTAKSIYNQGQGIVKDISGDKEGARAIDEQIAKDRAEGVNYGYLGKAKPLGASGNAGQDLKDAIGTGLEGGALVAGGGGGASVLENIGAKSLGKLALSGAATGAATGGLASLGQGLQDPNASVKDIAENTALGTGIGGVTGGLLAPIAGIAGKGVKGLSKVLGKSELNKIASDITPELTGKNAAKAIAKGGTTKSLVRGVIKPVISDNAVKDAEVIAKNVPGFSKFKTFSDKVNATRDAVYSMADQLKNDVAQSGKDRIYSFKELASKIMNSEEPISLKGTAFEKQITPLKDAVVKMAQKNGGNISSLFDTTKEFDQLVNKTWPNIWDRENAPMRNAVKSVRDTINNYIDENLPEGTDFLLRRRDQSKLFSAIDNMAPRAADEIGTTRLQRFGGRHPITSGLIKNAKRAAWPAIGTAIGVGGYEALK